MMLRHIKTPGSWLPGVFFGWLFLAAPLLADCPPPAAPLNAKLDTVIDGDTLRLTDGRRVRFLGIDAPELGRDGAPHEPLAQEATAAVRQLLADRKVGLVFGPERQDRYGRTLAYIYNSEGQNLEAALLRRGLAFHVAVPPNLALADCLQRQETHARNERLGVWGNAYWKARPAAALSSADAGFRRVRGTVTKVDAGKDIWLELDGPLVLRVSDSDKQYFGEQDWQQLQGKTLEVQGWIVDRSSSRAARQGFKPLLLSLRTPHAWRLLAD